MASIMKSRFVYLLLLSTLSAAAEPIPIGKQRQLFLDDHLVESAVHLTRRVQPAQKHPANPVIVKEHAWEPDGYFLPSVIYDEEEKIYKAWLDGGGPGVFYFTSRDGIQWERPKLHLFPEFDAEPANRVVLSGYEYDVKEAPPEKLDYLRSREKGWRYFCYMSGVFKDRRDPDPQRRYKMAFLWIDRNFQRPGAAKAGKLTALGVAFSPDGIHWKPVNEPVSYATLDAPIHITYDETISRWVMLGRDFGVVTDEKKAAHANDPNLPYNMGRSVVRSESTDFLTWPAGKGDLVMASDGKDSTMTEIYSLRGVPYEGIQIGLVHAFLNDPDGVTLPLQLGLSRDGKTWRRLDDRSAFLEMGGLGEWDRSVLSPPTSDPVVVGDELRFYYTGRNLLHSTRWKFEDDPKLLPVMVPHRGAMGFASIRRDRFVAMEASFRPGILRTKPFIHEGSVLHVNAAVKFGALTVSLLDDAGGVLQKAIVQGRDETDIALPEFTKLAGRKGQPVRLEFSLQNGRLFSFWVE